MEREIENVLHFWFEELEPSQHWIKDAMLDEDIARRFGTLHELAKQGKLSHWRTSPQGSLAEVIILDQFSRNIFRDEPESFASDDLARDLCLQAIDAGMDMQLSVEQRAFLYMPLMHSESMADHKRALELFNQPGLENNLEFEKRHMRIIERFGRYPHRNELLKRETTEEEREFLTQPGSSF